MSVTSVWLALRDACWQFSELLRVSQDLVCSVPCWLHVEGTHPLLIGGLCTVAVSWIECLSGA